MKSSPCFLRLSRRFGSSQVITGRVYIRIEYASRDKFEGLNAPVQRLRLWSCPWLFADVRSLRNRSPRARKRVGLRLAHWVAQVCNADARDHGRVTKDSRRASKAVKESNSGAKKYRRDVDGYFVEEAGIQQLLDGVSAVDPNGLPGRGGFGLLHGAFDPVGHEVNSRIGSRPSVGDVVGHYERGSPRVISVPAMGLVKRASTREHGSEFGPETAKVFGAGP